MSALLLHPSLPPRKSLFSILLAHAPTVRPWARKSRWAVVCYTNLPFFPFNFLLVFVFVCSVCLTFSSSFTVSVLITPLWVSCPSLLLLLPSSPLFPSTLIVFFWPVCVVVNRTRIWKPRYHSCRARSTTWRQWANSVPRWWTLTSVSTATGNVHQQQMVKSPHSFSASKTLVSSFFKGDVSIIQIVCLCLK